MFETIKRFFMNLLGTQEKTDLLKQTCVSKAMYERIREWNDILRGDAPWNKEARSCGVVNQIAGHLSMFVSREMSLEVENDAIKTPLVHLDKNIYKIVEYLTGTGAALLRPVFANEKLQYEVVPLGNYLPIEYDFDGTLLSAIILKEITQKEKHFLLTEKHEYRANRHTVTTKLFRTDGGVLSKVALTACESTAELLPVYVWENVKQPMVIEFKNQAVNKIDGSNVPVAIIAGAENLIEDADKQYERMNWEQKAGESRVFADRDLFTKRVTRSGDVVNVTSDPNLKRLFTMIEGDGISTGDKKIVEHTPTLRTAAQNEMFQQILRRIELACNLGKGTISDMEQAPQTATQYSGGRQALFAIIDKIEDEIEVKYQVCADVFAHMAAAYKLGNNNSTIIINWNDDATRKDQIQAKQIELQEISAGVRAKWEYRKDFFGEDEDQAKANTPEEQPGNFVV